VRFQRSTVLAGLAAFGLLVTMSAAGCGSAGDAGTIEIEGIVTVNDRPVSQASVAFIGNEGARLASALTDSSGRFSVRAAPGKNVVTVAKAPPGDLAPPSDESDESEEPELMPTEGEYAQLQKAVAPSEVPSKYGDPKTSGISFDIVAGMESIVLALSSK
jgi:hypothetical protein